MSIEKYFPEGERGLILVTTRNPANEVHGTIGRGSYHFEKLETDEANDLLLKAAGEHSPYKDSSRTSATLITKELGCLPLALVYAGQAIRQSLCSLTTYLNYYKRNWRRIRQARSDDTDLNVYSSYEILYQSLEGRTTEEEEARDAVELLKIFAFLHYENIRVQFFIEAVNNPKLERVKERMKTGQEIKIASRPKPWTLRLKELGLGLLEPIVRDRSRPVLPELLRSLEALTSFDDLRFLRALKELSQMSLITRHETSKSYSMHPLVHTWVRERPGMSTGEQAVWCEATITVLAQCILLPPLGSTAEDEALRRDLLPHINHVRNCQEEIRGSIAERQGKRNRPWPVLTPMFDRREALVLAKFSLVYAQCGHWREAEQLLLRVKNFIVPLLGLEHPRSIAVVLALSGTIWEQTRYNEAADLQAQLLQACLHSLGPNHPNTLRVKDTLGMSRCHQGRFWEAEELHKQAIAGMEKILGAEHEDTLVAQDRLGKVMFHLFRYGEARELHRKACAGLEKALGPNHLKTLNTKENLALAYLELSEELPKAHEMLEEVVAQRTKTLGKEQAWTLAARLGLAKVKTALGQVAEVEEMLLEGIPIARTNLGENHFGTLAGYHFYGQFLIRQQRYDEAEKILINVVERQNYAHGAQKDSDHANRLIAMYHLVGCYQLHGKIKEAIRDCDEILRILEKRNSIHPFRQWVRKKREELEAVESTPIDEKPSPDAPAENTSPLQQDGKPVWAWCKP
jgi:tetratricopeptide (TPR) repeat protein